MTAQMIAGTAEDLGGSSPFRVAAWPISGSGLGEPIPLPYGEKYPPPRGVTGKAGTAADRPTVEKWRHTGRRNVAIRLSPEVIGVDVDAYGEKAGAVTLAALEARAGRLPPTWISTSQPDGISGIRLYRISGDSRMMRDPGPGIEIVRRHHRYMLSSPSLHPSGSTYRWISPTGEEWDTPPDVAEIPQLPAEWEDLLTSPRAGRSPGGFPPA